MIEAAPRAWRLIMSATMSLEFVSRAMSLSSFLCLDTESSPEGEILSAMMFCLKLTGVKSQVAGDC